MQKLSIAVADEQRLLTNAERNGSRDDGNRFNGVRLIGGDLNRHFWFHRFRCANPKCNQIQCLVKSDFTRIHSTSSYSLTSLTMKTCATPLRVTAATSSRLPTTEALT